MTLAATFLGGAKSRLLPASIPIRFFVAAACFHVLMWPVLFFAADQVTGFRGGPGPALAAVHLLTLGVLTTTAIGASVQLLPVATRRALVAVWPIKLVFWLTVPGIGALVMAMYTFDAAYLIAAAALTTCGLLLFAGLLADNLIRATSLPVVAAYGWSALLCLVLLAALGLALAADYRFGFVPNHSGTALAHLILGGFGFMGLLALGFSHVLIPMFSLSSAPARKPAWLGFIAAIAAIVLGTLGALIDSWAMLSVAALTGLGAASAHLWLMQQTLRSGMRKRLGLSFVLIRTAWYMLPATLLVGLAALYGHAGANGPTLFAYLLLCWLLTFLLGVLQRILPFLASMHASARSSTPPLLSELAAAAPLKLHAICHSVALTAVAFAIALDSTLLVQIGSATGFVGAIAFGYFTVDVSRRALIPR